jgi:hypothetical protein
MSSTPLPGDDYQVTSVLNWRPRVHDTAAMKSFKKFTKTATIPSWFKYVDKKCSATKLALG